MALINNGTVVTHNILLLGMVYSTEQRPIVGQEYRDRVRIKGLEMLGYDVYTLDDKHEISFKTEPGKHCSSNFCDKRRLKNDMETAWGKSLRFDYIILDYFWCPEGWLQKRWNRAFFESTLPFFLNFEFLKYGGEIFLPWKRGVQELVTEAGIKLTLPYDLHFVSNPNENPLYAATDLCELDLMKCKKDQRRTNKSEMPELFKETPFLKLTKRKKYLPGRLFDDEPPSDESSSDDDEDEDKMEEEEEEDDDWGSFDKWGDPKPVVKWAGVILGKVDYETFWRIVRGSGKVHLRK